MTRTLLILLVALPTGASAFPGGQTFSGRVKCMTTYNDGGVPPFPSTDVITLAFTAQLTDANAQQGTVAFTHTEGSAAGMRLNEDDPSAYVAFEDANQGGAGLVGIRDPDGDTNDVSSAVAEYKAKPGAPIGSLRFVYVNSDSSGAQRCEGTLKAVRPPV